MAAASPLGATSPLGELAESLTTESDSHVRDMFDSAPGTTLNPPPIGGIQFNYTGFAVDDDSDPSSPTGSAAASSRGVRSAKSDSQREVPASILRKSTTGSSPSPSPRANSSSPAPRVGFAVDTGSQIGSPKDSMTKRSPRALAAAAGAHISIAIPPMPARRGTTTAMRRTSQMCPQGMGTLDDAGDVLNMINVAKRRASRYVALDVPVGSPKGKGLGLTLTIPDDPAVGVSPRAGADSGPAQEEVILLRRELEETKADVLQMADLGQNLLMDLEDMREKWNEADAEREKLERHNEDLVVQLHRQQRQCNELKALNAELRDQLEEERRKKAEEIAQLMENFHRQLQSAAESTGGNLAAGASPTEQSIALQQLRRAQLVQSRLESARAVFRSADANPLILETSQRQAIEQHMIAERCALWAEMTSAAHAEWWAVQNRLEVLEITYLAAQGQINNVIQARLRAEQQANVQSSLHRDVCKILSEKEMLIQRLQHDLTKYQVTVGVAKADVTPSIHQALLKVKRLNKNFVKTRGLLAGMGSPPRAAPPVSPPDAAAPLAPATAPPPAAVLRVTSDVTALDAASLYDISEASGDITLSPTGTDHGPRDSYTTAHPRGTGSPALPTPTNAFGMPRTLRQRTLSGE